jgi:centractin
MKECTNEVAESKESLEESARNEEKKQLTPYYLPDGSQISLGVERFLAPEIMFNPSKIGLEAPSVQEMIYGCLKKTDLDLRKTLYSEILLTGGNTMIRNFPERLLNELTQCSGQPSSKDVKVNIFRVYRKIIWSIGEI